jgi:hypothetical protein
MSGNSGDSGAISRRELEEKIVARAWTDEAFRRSFVANPKAEFESQLAIKLPSALKISVHEEDDSHLHFVIPAKPQADVSELSDADLEKVAGGVDVLVTVAVVSVVGGLAAAGGGVTAVVSVKTLEKEGWGKK